jgi:transposase-like protein
MNTYAITNISCPACRSAQVYKGDYDGILEQTVLRILSICPFLCQVCDTRFYLFLAATRNRWPERLQTWPDAEQCKVTLSSN